MKMSQVDGTSDNQMLGIDIQIISNTRAMDTLSVVSNSGGSAMSRQNYINILRLIRTVNTTSNATIFSQEFTKQVIKGLVPTPQSGVLVTAFSSDYLLFKYGYSKVVYGAAICGYGESYDSTTR